MFTALISFFGGSVFRMIWGEFSSWITKRQDHAQELDLLRLQESQAAAQHERNTASIRLQAELGVKTIQVQAESVVSEIETNAWLEAVKGTTKQVGIAWVDAWNAVIRPALATWAVAMITGHYLLWWVLDDNGWALAGAALGIYIADRTLFKRGK